MTFLNKKGIVLVCAYSFIVVSMGAICSFICSVISDKAVLERQLSMAKSSYLAEAGVEYGMKLLNDNPSENLGTHTLDLGQGRCTLNISYDHTKGLYIIDSDAQNPKDSVYAQTQASLRCYANSSAQPLFTKGVFGDLSVSLKGNAYIDSYDSGEGDYYEQIPGEEGDIGTNSTSSGAVSIIGNAQVQGDVYIGPGGDPEEVVELKGNGSISGGEIVVNSQEVELPEVVLPQGLACSGSLNISGNDTYVLDEGTYWFSSIRITGNAQLICSGSVEIYVSGDTMLAGNGVATAQNIPANLKLYVQGSHTVKIAGNADLVGAVYAPQSQIQVAGNGDVFGSLVGEEVINDGNANIHFDLALLDESSPFAEPQITKLVVVPRN